MDGFADMESPEVLRIHLGRVIEGELMASATVDACLALLAASDLTIVDLDGPPPELHPRFREIVILVRALRRRLVHRCNLAVASPPEYSDLPELLADHRVDVVAALPGRPSLDPATLSLMQSLRRFNAAGYGLPGSGLILDLVVPALQRDSRAGEASIATALESHGVRFTRLHVVPQATARGGGLVSELQRLAGAVHPARVLDVPCRSAVCVDWDGSLSECPVGGDAGALALGRNVLQVRSLDELFTPMAPPMALVSSPAVG
jgi:hypothetical protein